VWFLWSHLSAMNFKMFIWDLDFRGIAHRAKRGLRHHTGA
jgi:hypothetical protein